MAQHPTRPCEFLLQNRLHTAKHETIETSYLEKIECFTKTIFNTNKHNQDECYASNNQKSHTLTTS